MNLPNDFEAKITRAAERLEMYAATMQVSEFKTLANQLRNLLTPADEVVLCRNCHKPLSPDALYGHNGSLFCSPDCVDLYAEGGNRHV